MVLAGDVLVGIAWLMNTYADSLVMLYVAAAVDGVGAGAGYGTCVGNALKWFPDRRGPAAGLIAAGFGMGSALTIITIQGGHPRRRLAGGLPLFRHHPGRKKVARVMQSGRDYRWTEMIRMPVFWVMYLMFVMMAAGGSMATAQLGPIAKDIQIGDVPVSILGLTLPALAFALSIDFGWVSDHIGRENTMFIAFALEAVGIVPLSRFGTDPFWFVILTGLVFFAWGEIYSLCPSTVGDSYGSKFAATNAGLLYTAKARPHCWCG